MRRDRVKDRRQQVGHLGQHQHLPRPFARLARARRVGQKDHHPVPCHHLLHVRHGLVEKRVAGREDDDRHRAVDQRDGAVFQFTRRIAFGVDVADFLQFQRPFQRQREHRAPAQEQHVLRLGHGGGDGGDLPLAGQRLIDEAGQRRKVIQMAPHLGLRQVAAIKPGLQRQQQKHRQLTGEGLG